MKNYILFMALMCSVLMACGEVTSVSGDYLKSHNSADAVGKKKLPAPTPTPAPTPAPATGDVEKGKVLLVTCNGCHQSGVTKLNKAAITKLTSAYTGALATTHQNYKTSFENPGRLDLEAALNLIP